MTIHTISRTSPSTKDDLQRAQPLRYGAAVTNTIVALTAVAIVGTVLFLVWRNNQSEMIACPPGQTRLGKLAMSVEVFKMETGFYPGQADREQWAGRYTGSQVLAAHLFGLYDEDAADPYHKLSTDSSQGACSTQYAVFDETMLRTINGRANTIVDGWREGLAVCYYAPDETTDPSEFRFVDNQAYTGGDEQAFLNFMTTDREDDNVPWGPLMYAAHSGKPILISAGADRQHLTVDDEIAP